MSAFNSGFRSVAIVGYEFYVDNKKIIFDTYDCYPHPTKKNVMIAMHPKSKDKLPCSIKEGEITYTTISYVDFIPVLKRRKFKGIIEVSGYYKTAQNKIYWSKPIEINLDEW